MQNCMACTPFHAAAAGCHACGRAELIVRLRTAVFAGAERRRQMVAARGRWAVASITAQREGPRARVHVRLRCGTGERGNLCGPPSRRGTLTSPSAASMQLAARSSQLSGGDAAATNVMSANSDPDQLRGRRARDASGWCWRCSRRTRLLREAAVGCNATTAAAARDGHRPHRLIACANSRLTASFNLPPPSRRPTGLSAWPPGLAQRLICM